MFWFCDMFHSIEGFARSWVGGCTYARLEWRTYVAGFGGVGNDSHLLCLEFSLADVSIVLIWGRKDFLVTRSCWQWNLRIARIL